MTELQIALAMLGAIFIALLMGHPIPFSLGALAVIFGVTLWGGTGVLYLMAVRILGMMEQYILIAVPLFIFMGCMLERSGIADALYRAMHVGLGGLRGGLAIATIFICTLFAASTGIIAASITTMGLLALPSMLRRKYQAELAVGSVMTGGCLGILIPPSIMLIIYGAWAAESIGKLFAGAIFPGLLLSALYITYIAIRCGLRPGLGPPLPPEERTMPLPKKLSIVLPPLAPPLLLIVAVLGSIFAGIATPTEAAGMGALGVIIMAACYRKLNWTTVREGCIATLRTTSMVLWIVVTAQCFAAVFMGLGAGAAVSEFMLGLEINRYLILILIMFIIFILGMFLDWTEILIIGIPVFIPIVEGLGFDTLWFGILFAVNLQTSFITPPFGYALFFMRGIAPPGVTTVQIYRAVIPFLPLQVVALGLCIAFPQIILWLPGVLVR
ncbi:MAG TPA: TRAP transporter large permease subunit [Dehalococcoidia bacterium]|nr:TRAP transporter large permease subunit [Dehalococcoidia bacterium]